MSLTYVDTAVVHQNPLDLLEEIVGANDWAFDRASSDELAVEITGRWCDYRLYFLWQEDLGALHFSCLLESRVPIEKRREVSLLLALVNEKMWLGHFDLSSEDGTPMFRHTLLVRGAGGVSVEQMEDLVEVALSETERFFPAFQFVIWGGKSAEEAVASSLLDVVGEA
ncbi:MAG: YbjN domain-containing protein [Alphaproteobacteria bacterium]|nr:YbjN domain-containing protein [Alphaproteobacteria bacterium]